MAQLWKQFHREGGLPKMLFNDGDYLFVNELPRRPSRKEFFVI